MRMEGKVVIITGAASGLGKASVEKFAREGAIMTPVMWMRPVWKS
jgi:3-oxoacyl-[acyl-carrier protein] reductase